MDFIAIDVETANPDMASICQIGLVKYERGILAHEWRSYVDPGDYFDDLHVGIHGIDELVVRGAPTFPALSDVLFSHLKSSVVVCHTHFDRVALHQSSRRYSVELPDCKWLDSARVARRTWAECASKAYGLHSVCEMLGYTFRHHDALEDAKAAAQILIAAAKETGLDLDGWLKRVSQPINIGSGDTASREGNPDGPLNGEVLAFTGSLQMPRRTAADLAALIGCKVTSGVTKRTTMLVVGDQDVQKLAGHTKSAKHRKVETLIEAGASIRILRESDFVELVKVADNVA